MRLVGTSKSWDNGIVNFFFGERIYWESDGDCDEGVDVEGRRIFGEVVMAAAAAREREREGV